MELIVWSLELYARYVVIVVVLGASVALAAWLSSAVASWSNRRHGSAGESSD